MVRAVDKAAAMLSNCTAEPHVAAATWPCTYFFSRRLHAVVTRQLVVHQSRAVSNTPAVANKLCDISAMRRAIMWVYQGDA